MHTGVNIFGGGDRGSFRGGVGNEQPRYTDIGISMKRLRRVGKAKKWDDVITLGYIDSKMRKIMSHDLAAFKHEIDKKFTELERVEFLNVSNPVDQKLLKKKLLILEMTKLMKAKVRTDEIVVRMKSIGEELNKLNADL